MNEENKITVRQGLVISDKQDRIENDVSLPSSDEIREAVATFAVFEEDHRTNSNRHFVSVSPGMIKVSKTSKLPNIKSPNYQPRKPISEWSSKSRSNMVSVLSSLNYIPLFENRNFPALITLTYPKNFQTLCPDAATGRRHLKVFRQRFERKYGKLRGIYKWEFQRSGSPHIHMFVVPPRGKQFKDWLSRTWAEVVGEVDPTEYQKHISAGTAIDYAQAANSTDPKRIVVYFLKHSSPTQGGQKEYQNQPPEFWKEAGSVGRFWGRWGLEVLTESVEVSESEAIFTARILRKLAKSLSKPRVVNVWRVNQRTGVVSKRKVHRRPKRMRRSQGFSSVNDGAVTGKAIARAIEARFGSRTSESLTGSQTKKPKLEDMLKGGLNGN